MKRSVWTMSASMMMALITLNSTVGADVGVEANPLLGGGSSGEDVDFIVGSQGDLTIEFQQKSLQTRPSTTFGEANPSAELSPTWHAFRGDYLEAGVKGVQFRIRNNGEVLPYNTRIAISSPETGVWSYRNVQIDPGAGQWATNTIVFDRRIGWDRSMNNATEEEKQEHFERTLSNVGELSIYFQQDNANRDKLQSVTIDDFVLFGDGWMSDEARLAAGLVENFGVQSRGALTPDQFLQDSDRDGESDVDEITKGEDPGLAIEIVEFNESGVLLEWPCVERKSYTIYRADSLDGEFKPIHVIEADQNGFMQYRDTGGGGTGGPYYYKVRKSDS